MKVQIVELIIETLWTCVGAKDFIALEQLESNPFIISKETIEGTRKLQQCL
jgi:hypothetical protein